TLSSIEQRAEGAAQQWNPTSDPNPIGHASLKETSVRDGGADELHRCLLEGRPRSGRGGSGRRLRATPSHPYTVAWCGPGLTARPRRPCRIRARASASRVAMRAEVRPAKRLVISPSRHEPVNC